MVEARSGEVRCTRFWAGRKDGVGFISNDFGRDAEQIWRVDPSHGEDEINAEEGFGVRRNRRHHAGKCPYVFWANVAAVEDI